MAARSISPGRAARELLRRELAGRFEPPPPFSLAAFCGDHAKQLAFVTDQSHRVHVMCARQSGKSQGDDGILMDTGLLRPNSTNLILGLNGPAIRNNNWEPIWKRLFDRFSGLDPKWRNETRMLTTFPNGARVFMGGSDDARHIKNLLGGRIEDGVVIIDECQDQGHVLDELLDSILPPMMGMNARLILSGVFPEVPAGRFWRESGWVERGGIYVQERIGAWSPHNWGRLANVHTPDARAVLDRYLTDTGLTEDHPQIQRDWFGRPAFDPTATAYRYRVETNSYLPVLPDWLREVYAAHIETDPTTQYRYAHPMRLDKDGARYGMMAAEPLPGVTMFSLALDPGANSDRASIQGWGWGERSREVQHVFDWSSPRGARLTTGQMFAVLGLAYRTFTQLGAQRGGVVRCRYDAGSSQNTIDNLLGDYGIPVVLAAKKADLKGQVDRNNDLLEQGRARVMAGSALEQDYQRARWDKSALATGQRSWAASWHPDPSEAARYALQDYFDVYEAPPPPPANDGERHREAIRAELAEVARQEARAREDDGDPQNW
jgi:hypothetical protein